MEILSAGVALLVAFFGFRIMVRGGRGTGSRGQRRATADHWAAGLNTLLAYSVIWQFFGGAAAAGTLSTKAAVGMLAAVVLGVALVPSASVLVSFAALAVFLIRQPAAFGAATPVLFAAMLVGFVLIRHAAGRR